MTFPSQTAARVSWGRGSFRTSQVHRHPAQLPLSSKTHCFSFHFSKPEKSFKGWAKGQRRQRWYLLRVHELLTLQLPVERLQSGGETWERPSSPGLRKLQSGARLSHLTRGRNRKSSGQVQREQKLVRSESKCDSVVTWIYNFSLAAVCDATAALHRRQSVSGK